MLVGFHEVLNSQGNQGLPGLYTCGIQNANESVNEATHDATSQKSLIWLLYADFVTVNASC